MDRWIDRTCRVLDGTLALALAAMVVMVFGNVVLRYAFNTGITVSEELSRWCFVWLTFLGALVGLRERSHLGTDVLVSRLPPLGRRACLAVGQLLMLAVTVVLLLGSWSQSKINLDVEAPVTGWSMAWVYGAGVVFAVPAIGLIALQVWRTVSGRLRDDELIGVRESEEVPAEGRPR